MRCSVCSFFIISILTQRSSNVIFFFTHLLSASCFPATFVYLHRLQKWYHIYWNIMNTVFPLIVFCMNNIFFFYTTTEFISKYIQWSMTSIITGFYFDWTDFIPNPRSCKHYFYPNPHLKVDPEPVQKGRDIPRKNSVLIKSEFCRNVSSLHVRG